MLTDALEQEFTAQATAGGQNRLADPECRGLIALAARVATERPALLPACRRAVAAACSSSPPAGGSEALRVLAEFSDLEIDILRIVATPAAYLDGQRRVAVDRAVSNQFEWMTRADGARHVRNLTDKGVLNSESETQAAPSLPCGPMSSLNALGCQIAFGLLACPPIEREAAKPQRPGADHFREKSAAATD